MAYSLNAPLPPAVRRQAGELRADLPADVRPRERPTLVVKRVGEGDRDHRELAARARDVLDGVAPCAARTAGLDAFESSTGPVVHVTVESPGLRRLHERLCRAFDPVEGIEGDDYASHVTLGRGGDPAAVAAFCERSIDPVGWTVDALSLWSERYREPVAHLPLG